MSGIIGTDKLSRAKVVIAVIITLLILCAFMLLQKKNKRLNVILITIDALRADHLGCYGYPRNTSPKIDALAAQGALFTQAFSTVAQTVPSLTSLASSTYISSNHVFLNSMKPDSRIPSLPLILRNNGYCTGFISGHGSLGGFLKEAFDAYDDQERQPADLVTAKANEWVKSNQNKPFFFMVALFRHASIPARGSI
jgi:arylsulfatase A-like enzyme